MTKIQDPMQILTDFIDGQSVESLAAEHGVHPTTIYRSLHKQGVQNLKAPGANDGRNELIASEYQAGCKVTDIAKRYRLAVPTIYAIIRQYKNSCI